MCSFLFTNKTVSDEEIQASNCILKNRGPDSTVYKYIDNKLFLHNRLSIADNLIQPYTKNNITLLFNGEIYNYTGVNEAEFIIDAYINEKYNFHKHLDGEYAILLYDHHNQKLIVCVDTFKTKPLWFSFENFIGISSYRSSLENLNFKDIHPVPCNTTLIYDLRLKTYETLINTKFNLEQTVCNYDSVLESLDRAITKRCGSNKKIFSGLSSGYDSGVISCCVQRNNLPVHFYSICNHENKYIIEERSKKVIIEKLNYSKKDRIICNALLSSICEKDNQTEYSFTKDDSACPLFHLGRKAKQDGCRVFLSGTGGDEIFGDYYIAKSYVNSDSSCFKGIYPEDLASIFPWKNFLSGTMRKFLTKDEYIIGSLGIETRYPFLDILLVQNFLNLSCDLKNKHYKAPMHEYLIRNNFPFSLNEKIGFGIYV